MRMEIITRSKLSVKYKVIATSVDNLEMDADKARGSNKKRKYRNLNTDERIERQETEYVGVSWDKNNQRWHATIQIGKKIRFLGRFDSDYDAAMRYDEEARKQGKSVNFPYKPEDEVVKKKRNLSADERIESQETEYKGVSWNKRTQRWRAAIKIGNKTKNLGCFESDYDAAIRYDKEARRQGRAVNFQIHLEDVQAEKRRKNRTLSGMERIEHQETKYVGICWKKSKQRWIAEIQIGKKKKYLGSFDSDYDAAMKYDEEARKHNKPLNFKFSEEEVQAEKRKKPRKLSDIERIERQETEYVGVSWSKSAQQWVSQIRVNKKVKRLGYFDSDKGAAMKYDEEARKHGRPVNFPIHPADVQAEKQNKG